MARFVVSAGLGSQRRVLLQYRQAYYRLTPESWYTRNYTFLAACMKVSFLCVGGQGHRRSLLVAVSPFKYVGYQTEVSCVQLQVY
jgi:hypothetical protein